MTSLFLALCVLTAVLSACPRGGHCPLLKQASHSCCEKGGPSLSAVDCCNSGVAFKRPGLGTERSFDGSITLVAIALLAPIEDPGVSNPAARTTSVATSGGLAPPGSLFSHHTSLLV